MSAPIKFSVPWMDFGPGCRTTICALHALKLRRGISIYKTIELRMHLVFFFNLTLSYDVVLVSKLD